MVGMQNAGVRAKLEQKKCVCRLNAYANSASMPDNGSMSSQHIFQASNVTAVAHGDAGDKVIFNNLHFEIRGGEIVDITGPSGSGKSTLLTAFARLNVNTAGTFTLDGVDSDSLTPQQWRERVAYLPQTSVLIGETVIDAIRLPFTLRVRTSAYHESAERRLPDALVRETLDSMGCEDIDLTRPVHELSGGQAARVSLARTLLTHPAVLLADEVDAGLDDENANKVADILRAAADAGTAVVRIRHRQADGRANKIIVLANGTLSDAPAQQPQDKAQEGQAR